MLAPQGRGTIVSNSVEQLSVGSDSPSVAVLAGFSKLVLINTRTRTFSHVVGVDEQLLREEGEHLLPSLAAPQEGTSSGSALLLVSAMVRPQTYTWYGGVG